MKIINDLINWFDDRTGLKKPIMDMMAHPVPPGAKWYYVFGTAILTCFIVQLVTGVALSTLYVPSAGQAYETVRWISTQAPFGGFVRAMHYFGASAMILFVGIHAMQTYIFGAFKYPRELNWLSGVALLFITVAMGFTGQILRWDQNSVWTIAVGAEQALRAPIIGPYAAQVMLWGAEVGSSTLSHFYSLHVFVFPGLLIALIGLHLYLVLHNGISEPPVSGELVEKKTYREKYHAMLDRIGQPFWPDAAWRDVVFSALVIVGIIAFSLHFGPPELDNPPDPSIIKAQPKPDWYLLWYFALLALLPHDLEDYVILGFPVLMILALLSPPFISSTGERSPAKRPWAVAVVVFIVSAVGALWIAGATEPWSPNFEAKPLTNKIIGASAGPTFAGAQVFNDKGCLYCHAISGHGGQRGPDLTLVGTRLSHDQLVIRIVNGGYNMPAYAGNITPKELSDLTAFLETRKFDDKKVSTTTGSETH